MKKKECSWLVCIFLFFVGLCLFATSASAAVVTWVGTSSYGVWDTPTNWSGGYVPGSTDDVVLPDIGKNYQVAIVLNPSNPSTFTINSLTVEGNDFTTGLLVYNNGDLTVIDTLDIHSRGTLGLSNGGRVHALGPITVDTLGSLYVGAAGTLQIDDSMTYNGNIVGIFGNLVLNGTLQSSTTLGLEAGATLTGTGGIINITSPGYLMVRGSTSWGGSITNQSEIRWLITANSTISCNDLTFTNDGMLINGSGLILDLNATSGSNSFINNGTGRVYNSSAGTISFNIPFTNNNGATVYGHNIAFGSTFTNNTGGILQGWGPFDFSGATVTNNGTMDPKTSSSSNTTNAMSITGDFPLGASSTTLIELEYWPGSDDKLVISGGATLGGTLEVSLIGYTPTLGHSMEILTAASVSGTFDALTLPPLNLGLEWYVHYNPTNVTLEVVEIGSTFNDLTVSLDGSGSGIITSSPAGIDCGSTCTHSFVTSNPVTLTVTADTGSVFVNWSGDTDCADGVLAMEATTSCTATFDLDSDSDGLGDSVETALGTSSSEPDSDFDGVSDFDEVNIDGDPTSYTVGVDTDPTDPDTDGDGYYDGAENSFGSDPLDPGSTVGSIVKISIDSNGVGANNNSNDLPSISNDGRYVVFQSDATNLLTETDTNGRPDTFLKDTITGVTTRVSTDSNGLEANQTSSNPFISANGRYVVFESGATNLVGNDTNTGVSDIFLKDTQTGTITLVSTDSSGVQGPDGSEDPAVSGDGRYVVFRSFSDNLVAGDTNDLIDIFLKDTVTGEISWMSTDSNGAGGNDDCENAGISSDGRYVVFETFSDNLVAGDTNGWSDIFLKDTVTDITTRVSTDSNNTQGNGYSGFPAISSNGRYVVFYSYANNLVADDTNGVADIFLKDTVTDITTRVSTDSSGAESTNHSQISSVSDDGRYVVFDSFASNLVTGDTNNTPDIFLKDTITGSTIRLSTNSIGIQGNNLSEQPVISGDGNFIAFKSSGSNLVAGDSGGFVDMFQVVNQHIIPANHDLTFILAGSGSGTVTSNPAGINCGTTCNNVFPAGTSVTLTATADTGSVFASWSGDADCVDGVITMSITISCTATFALDADNDGIADNIEDINLNGIFDAGETDPNNPDTDGDGLNDGVEDANHNGLVDGSETDPRDADSDNDGLNDGLEVFLDTDPTMADTNEDGTPDGDEDTDGDGFTNAEEVQCSSDPGDPSSKCRRGLPFLMLLLE
jgi:hypothetical protein